MANILKTNGFLLAFDRVFTRPDHDAYDLIHFTEANTEGDETFPAMECPENWSSLAAEVLVEQAASVLIPAHTKAIEENTVPSWLWQHVGNGKVVERETNIQQIFTRVVGAAVYKGWKQDIFADEIAARNFYDEARYALAQRFIAFEPKLLARLGVDWAYGLKSTHAVTKATKSESSHVELSNRTIDNLVSGTAQTKWQKLLAPKHANASIAISFTDIASDWGSEAQNNATTAVLDLMAFRHNDGSVNIDAIQHATKLLTVLHDLHDMPMGLGFVNLAPLLLALALPYDSDAARNLAASISAVITAEAYATSAELAALRGMSADYTKNRETILRNLRNHRRAAYGDRNDYEKLSVLPAPLDVKKAPDLALVATAQRRFDEALDLVRRHGLRQAQVTALSPTSNLSVFMESNAQGITPTQSLTVLRNEGEIFRRQISTTVIEALSRLGYDKNNGATIIQHIAGHMTLAKAPVINHASLQTKGFDAATLEALENYLPNVTDIRLAFTPWIVGQDFCRKVLKIPAQKLQSTSFDLLKHLGFPDEAITVSNAFCYGHGGIKGCTQLKPQHAAVFAQKNDVAPEAHIRMAASVQSFISQAVAVDLSVNSAAAETSEKLLLSAWRQGLRAVAITCVETPVIASTSRKPKRSMSAFLHTQARPALPTRRVTAKASHRMVSLKPGTSHKSTSKSKSK